MLRGKSYLNTVGDLLENLKANTGMAVGLHWREWSREELIELFQASEFELEHHAFDLYAKNSSNRLRKVAVAFMYKLQPSLMPSQSATFSRLDSSGSSVI